MEKGAKVQTDVQRQQLYEWSQKVVECCWSGKSVKHWCEENGTNTRTYYNWQRKVFAFLMEDGTDKAGKRFVELPVFKGDERQQAAELIAHVQIGDADIELYAGAKADMVKALCQAIKRC